VLIGAQNQKALAKKTNRTMAPSHKISRKDAKVQRRGLFWTAPAERSGDGAFARAEIERTNESLRPHESGVALRFPPQSKRRRVRLALSRFEVFIHLIFF
jgi:hypothetical protein